jgi:hypothetical protein
MHTTEWLLNLTQLNCTGEFRHYLANPAYLKSILPLSFYYRILIKKKFCVNKDEVNVYDDAFIERLNER